ncbi:MAG: serine hydrolase [Acidobacteria bacterium]|nr:serine hydrolase [Acidobacteriota bacterium]
MRQTLLLLLLPAALLAADARHPVAASTRPEEVGLSSARLERATAEMRADVEAGRLPGALGLVARHGKVAYFETVGQADKEKGLAMAPDTIFRIYSMSKPITTAALLMLHEEGKYRLTDPVSRYIPELKGRTVAEMNVFYPGDPKHMNRAGANREITIQDLMRHTAGFAYGNTVATPVDVMYQEAKVLDANATLKTMIDRLAKLPLLYQPGEKWHYSIAVDVQGRLVEVLSGKPFDVFLRERIFEPLGMADTGFSVPKADQGRFAQMYGLDDDKLSVADPEWSTRYLTPPAWKSGGGGLVSTAMDYFRFCQMLLNGGELDGRRLLSRKTVELMTRDHLAGVDPGRAASTGYGFGLGVAVHVDPAASGSAASVGEYNWGGAAGTKFWIDPQEELIGVYMIQIRPGGGRFGQIYKELAYQAIAD